MATRLKWESQKERMSASAEHSRPRHTTSTGTIHSVLNIARHSRTAYPYANHTYRIYDLNKDNDWEFELDGNRKKSDLSTGHSAGQISTGGESTYSGNTMKGHMSSLQYITTYSGSSSYTSTTWDNHTPSDNNSYYWLDECTGSAHYNFYFGTGSSGNPC